MDGLKLTPDAGLAVQPSSAVAVLVSIKVSADQKKKKMVNQKGDWTVALMFLKLLMTVNISDRSPAKPTARRRKRSAGRMQLVAELGADLRCPDAKSPPE